MNALRSALAVLAAVSTLHAQDSRAVLFLSNGDTDLQWHIGEPAPSIALGTDTFVAAACGPELVWVYNNFPTLPMRAIGTATAHKRALISGTPTETDCVIWRGDLARFIADNLGVEIN
jgi:hypothetical protein